jgi:beta-glucanase (GH16 family)
MSIGMSMAALSMAVPQAIAQTFSATPVWSEDFKGGTERWNVYDGPFATNNYTFFQRPNVWVDTTDGNGYLNLAILKDSGSQVCTSGGVDTQFSHTQRYGKWEVRAKVAPGYGAWTYIGLFPENPSVWPPEVDFAEVIGKMPTHLYLTQHYLNKGQVSTYNTTYNNSNTDWSADFHTYTVEWIPKKISYYVDGVKVAEQPDKVGNNRMKLAIGTACGAPGSWADHPDNATVNGFPYALPSFAQVDWVKIYRYTP